MCSTMVWLLLVLVVALIWVGCGLVAALYFGRRDHVSSRKAWGYLRMLAVMGPLAAFMAWHDEV